MAHVRLCRRRLARSVSRPAQGARRPPPSPQAQAAAAHPGFGEAILQMLSQLASALNPKVPRAPRATEAAIEAQSNGQPAPQGLGGQFHPGQ